MRQGTILARQAASEAARRAMLRLRSSRLYSWRYRVSAPADLRATLADLEAGDPERAEDIYSGSFDLAGQTIQTGVESPFLRRGDDADWLAALHGFVWLRELTAADTHLSRVNAGALVADWTTIWGHRYESLWWRPGIAAIRLMAFLRHARTIMAAGSDAANRTFLRTIARHARFLALNLQGTGKGEERLRAAIAIHAALLALGNKERALRSSGKTLGQELSRQILVDGIHVSRNPVTQLHLLGDLISLAQLHAACAEPAPPALQPAIDRMVAALRLLQHADGSLARFNGSGITPSALLDAVFAAAAPLPKPPRSAPEGGFERLAAGKTVVVVDTGAPFAPAADQTAFAGTLSFELSRKQQRFIGNCGAPPFGSQRYAPWSRSTAAHSTVTIDDTSSSRFAGDGAMASLLPGHLLLRPPVVSVERASDGDEEQLTVLHDGYEKPFGITHERTLILADKGNVLNGIDRFVASGQRVSDHVANIRFHLPPDVSASPLSSGHSILLAADDGTAWTITCIDAPITIEESVCFAQAGLPRRSEQVVISASTAAHSEVRWSLQLREKRTATRNRADAEETPDLLDTLDVDA